MKAIVFLCLVVVVEGQLPDLTRIVPTFPFTPVLEGNEAYIGVIITLELVALSLLIGLYPGKRSVDDFTMRTPLWSHSQIDTVMDSVAMSDNDDCIAKLICNLGAKAEESLSPSQHALITYLKSGPFWIEKELNLGRNVLKRAVHIGSFYRNADGDSVCENFFQKCSCDLQLLANYIL